MSASVCQPGSGRKDLNRLPYLAEPLLRFDLNHELEELRREESWERETGRSSKTLAKYPDFRIVLVCMKAGSHMNDHKADARISIQALEGKILLHVPDQNPIELSAGQLMTLDCWGTPRRRSFGRKCVSADHRLVERRGEAHRRTSHAVSVSGT